MEGGGGNAKLCFELIQVERCVRCAQGHSPGSGVRPDVLPIARGMQYVVHGAILGGSHCIAKEGIRNGDRLRVHFCVCDSDGHVVGRPNCAQRVRSFYIGIRASVRGWRSDHLPRFQRCHIGRKDRRGGRAEVFLIHITSEPQPNPQS